MLGGGLSQPTGLAQRPARCGGGTWWLPFNRIASVHSKRVGGRACLPVCILAGAPLKDLHGGTARLKKPQEYDDDYKGSDDLPQESLRPGSMTIHRRTPTNPPDWQRMGAAGSGRS